MVELAIILPLFFMLLFAIVEFAVAFGRWQTISNAAREGARTAVVARTNCVSGNVEAEVRTRVQNYAAPLGMTIPDGDISVAGQCGASDTTTSVSVSFTHTFSVLPNFAGSVSPSVDLVGRSVMRNEGSI